MIGTGSDMTRTPEMHVQRAMTIPMPKLELSKQKRTNSKFCVSYWIYPWILKIFQYFTQYPINLFTPYVSSMKGIWWSKYVLHYLLFLVKRKRCRNWQLNCSTQPVLGYMSPYPTVVMVIIAHQNEIGMDVNGVSSSSFSAK